MSRVIYSNILFQSKNKMQLYFAHYQRIVVLDSEGKLVREMGNATAASGLDYHLKKNLLFFTDVNARKVYQVRLCNQPSTQNALTKTTYRPYLDRVRLKPHFQLQVNNFSF